MLAPTGNVTLVFTSVHACAALWAINAETARHALSLHDKIIRETLRQHGGYEVKSENGAFMLAFQSAAAAIACSCAVQMRLLVAPWEDALLRCDEASEVRSERGKLIFAGLRVSIGLHSGSPDCRIDPTTGRMDYFGPLANRAARIEAAAHEGQALASHATHAACGEEPHELMESLGEHRLRGLEHTVRLYNIGIKGLGDRRFPAPLSLDAIHTNLDAPEDRFIGRTQAIKSINQFFQQGHRLVTLMGPSGIGKTRLAKRYGGIHLEEFPGGVWFCDLAEARDLNRLIGNVGHALMTPLTTGRSDQELLTQLGVALEKKGRALIILDNLEQVVEAASQALDVWVTSAPELCVLTTSQERLRLSAEAIYDLQPLSEAEAVELFEVRAREARATYQPSVNELDAISRVVNALDHIPLAIELAAAQVHHTTAQTLSKQLHERLDILISERPESPKRHHSLRAAISWAWNLLDTHEQDALAQVSVFQGGFTLESAEAVVSPSSEDAPWVLDLLESLRDKSFLRCRSGHDDDADLRFEVYESIRIFAEEALLAQDKQSATRERHIAHYCQESLEWTEGLYGYDGIEKRQRLAQERQNFETILSWDESTPQNRGHAAFALAALLKIRGPNQMRQRVLQSVENDLSSMTPALSCVVLRGLAECEREAGEFERSVQYLERALRSAKEADDAALEGRVLGTLGLLQRARGEMVQASESIRQALACARRCGDDPTRGAMLSSLAALEHDRARFQEAKELFLEALELAASRNQSLSEATAQMNLGTICTEQGKHGDALDYYGQAKATFSAQGHRSYETLVSAMIGLAQLDNGATAAARKSFDEALAVAISLGDLNAQVLTECWHGLAHWLEDETEVAFVRLQAAVHSMRELANPKSLAFAHGYYGAILAQRGRIGEARQEMRLARYLIQQTGNRNYLDTLKILVGVASSFLAHQASEAGDERSFRRHLGMAQQRVRYAQTPVAPDAAFPDGLPAPIERSADARISLKILKKSLDQLHGDTPPT